MPSATDPSVPRDGLAALRATVDVGCVGTWAAQVERRFAEVEEVRRTESVAAVGRVLAAGERFVETASSLTLGAVFTAEDLPQILAAMARTPIRAWIERVLRGPAACDLEQAWLRRQYAPANYPPLHAPHGWHQDGALGFDFLAHRDTPFPPDALLPTVTCWIPLTPCGVEAPGLELLTRRFDGLLAPADLTEERVRTRFAPKEFWRPAMEPGDVLLFCGDILHRTHVTPAMFNDRTSIELRFFPANNIPGRLARDRFLPLA